MPLADPRLDELGNHRYQNCIATLQDSDAVTKVERASFGQLLLYPGFVRLWMADGLSNFGTFIFGLSLQLLLIQVLNADQLEIGWVRSAQWLPSLLFGLLAGVVVDRVQRKQLLIATDIASCVLLLAIAGMACWECSPRLGWPCWSSCSAPLRYCRVGRINRSPPTCCRQAFLLRATWR
ncbi:MFS transporter [Devosia neptuniae]|uniref:MFS transporter n=1 Tax=Devosia neptuniae TaxID=191302 RepID=A0ABY6CAN4_9HYPH|nr:MFS transporter [Devosia neptuniae]UXN68888.1 MFS transporter [Devosia neptuniae]